MTSEQVLWEIRSKGDEPHECNAVSCPEGGSYYVSCVDDNGHLFLMAGPYQTHQAALADVQRATSIASDIDGRAWFMSWGTIRRKDGYSELGRLNKHGRM